MIVDLVWVPVAASLLIAGWALIQCVRNRRFDAPRFYAVALLEAVMLTQLAVGLVALVQTARDVDAVTFVSYL